MKRTFDFILAIGILVFFLVPMVFIIFAIYFTSEGSLLYWSPRVGKNNKIFYMPKFRSMLTGTPCVATHSLKNPDLYLSPIGGFLRKSSLDELPQLYSILKGDMSCVGPRHALPSQRGLINLRSKKGVNNLLPGLTGWAQINGRDKLLISKKVAFDLEYLNRQSFWFDIKILFLTFFKVLIRESVSH